MSNTSVLISAVPLEAQIRALFPSGTAIAVTDPRLTYAQPFPSESSAVSRANDRRRREFNAGRAAVRDAMQQFALSPKAVPNGPDRAPIWPDGLVGSISHSGAVCVAAVARSKDARSVGIDVEEDTALDPELVSSVCTLVERAWLSAQPKAQRGLLAKLIFSAKECAYKCQYPISRTVFDFDTLEITPDLDTGQFEATFTKDVACFAQGSCFHGRFIIESGVIVTTTVLTQRPRWSLDRP